MRAYRARKRGAPAAAKTAAAAPRVDTSIPLGRELTIAEKRDDAQLEAIEARGKRAAWTGKEWREAPPPAPAPATARPPTPPVRTLYAAGAGNRALTVHRPPLQGEVIPPPRSMMAGGGAPPRRYPPRSSVAETTALIRAYRTRIDPTTALAICFAPRRSSERLVSYARLSARAISAHISGDSPSHCSSTSNHSRSSITRSPLRRFGVAMTGANGRKARA
jgi:hypothetical protein